MSSRLMQMALPMITLALLSVALRAQTVTEGTTPKTIAALEATNSALNVPIEEIAETAGGCAALDKNFPGLRAHTMYYFFKTMSLNQIAAMSSGQISTAMLAQAQADLSALPIKIVARNVQKADGKDLDFPSPDRRGVRDDGSHK